MIFELEHLSLRMIAAGATMATPEVIASREHALAVTRDYIKQPRLSKFAYMDVCR